MNSLFTVVDDSGWYIGGSIGQSRAEIDDARITANLLGVGPALIADDSRNTGYKLFGGYQYNKNLAVEAGYFDLGQFGYTATFGCSSFPNDAASVALSGDQNCGSG